MTKHTSRDKVWSEALRCALLEESFSVERIQNRITTEVSDRTIRDTLNTMADLAWLEKDSSKAHDWYAGSKLQGLEELEENFESSTTTQAQVAYSPVDEVNSWILDRVSNSTNLVIEKDGPGHLLGTHGALEESVKIPYSSGKPVRVSLPRLYQESRVLVCREQEVIQRNGGISGIRQPSLHIGDIVPVRMPIAIQGDTNREVGPKELDGVPLPLFEEVEKLRLSESHEFKSGRKYAVEIESIYSEVAVGKIHSKSPVSSGRASSTKSLADIAEKVGTVTESSGSHPVDTVANGWDDRRKKILTDISSSYD